MQLNLDPRDAICVARQPILDRSERVFGYELLYRARSTDTACTTSRDIAAARGMIDAALVLGLDTIAGGRPAFMNFTRDLLVGGCGSLIPPEALVIEILEDVEVDAEVLEACKELHAQGYALALDDFEPGSSSERLLPYAKFVKVDVLLTSADTRADLARQLGKRGIQLIAEKVEAPEMAQQVRAAGYHLVQGFYFGVPPIFSARPLPSRRLASLQLFTTLSRPDLSITQVEDAIKHDTALVHRVLRCVNSAAFAIQQEVDSLRQAVVLLGVDQIRKWASVWALAGVNTGGTPELVMTALLRARCCELLGHRLSDEYGDKLFLLGLCSLLDVMLGQPMDKALADLPLSAELRQALLGDANDARTILDAVAAYERGGWDESEASLGHLGLSAVMLSEAYVDALSWARQLSRESLVAA